MTAVRKAVETDIEAVTQIYDHVLDNEEAGKTTIGWKRGVYPTKETAKIALDAGELFVMTDEGKIVAVAIINQKQVPEYNLAKWRNEASADKVMVLHTLVVDPTQNGHGYGTAFVRFYEEYAREHNCPYLRMDTNVVNTPARRLYNHLGYEERGIVPCSFNGIDGVNLVCLEKLLK